MSEPEATDAAAQEQPEQAFSPQPRQGEPRLVVFFILLPAPLGLPHNSTYIFYRDETVDWLAGTRPAITQNAPPISLENMDEEEQRILERGNNFVSLRLWLPKDTVTMPSASFKQVMDVLRIVTGGSLDGEQATQNAPVPINSNVSSFNTIVEAVTPLLKGDKDNYDDALTYAFDRCIEAITLLNRSYALASGDLRMRVFSRQALQPIVPFTTRHPERGDWSPVGFLLINPGYNLPGAAEDLTREQRQAFQLYLSRLLSQDPFMTVAEWQRHSHQAYEVDGDAAAAVNAAHTAGEVLFDTVLLTMAWETGVAREEASSWFADTGLTTRLRTHYHPKLRGRWNPDDEKSVLGRWTRDVTRLRGRVVHAGYRPTTQEAATALAALDEVIDFVKERLAANRLAYPRTTLMFLGHSGLERLGLFNGKIKAFAESEAPKEDDWFISYRQWFDC